MTRLTAGLAAFWLLAGAVAAGAQGLRVSYLEGSTEVRDGSSWRLLSIGDSVPQSATVRLGAKSCVRLKGTGVEVVLTRPGTYVVKDIFAARKALSSGYTGSLLRRALRYLGSGSTDRGNAVLGARAGNKGAENEGWVESSAEVFLQAGKEYIRAGEYDRAAEQLEQALEYATEGESPEIHFYLAYVLSQDGKTAEAWKQAERLSPGSGDSWASDYVLLRARLLIDSSAYAEAAEWLAEHGKGLSQDVQRAQLFYVLLGLAYRGEGLDDQAKQALSDALTISSESDLGKAAAAILETP